MKMEQSVPKRRYIKFRSRGVAQKKTHNNQLYHSHRVENFRLIPIKIKGQVGKEGGKNGTGLTAAEKKKSYI